MVIPPNIVEVTLGLAATELLKTVQEAKNKAVNFKAILADLETTTINLVPKVSRIEQISIEMGELPKEEIQRLKLELQGATQLVSKCKKIARWNYCKRYRHSNKLLQLHAALRRVIEMELPVGHAEDHKQILMELRNIRQDIRATSAACFVLMLRSLYPGFKHRDMEERDGNGSRISRNGAEVTGREVSAGRFKSTVLSASSWIVSFFKFFHLHRFKLIQV